MESLFVYYNPNPLYKAPKAGKSPKRWRIGDCAVRAICKASGMEWIEAYRFATESALKVFEPFNCSFGFAQVMKDLGYEKVSYPRGQKRETVREFCKNHPNITAVINLASHFVTVENGKYYDVWDCGGCTAYNYWIKK